jgi:2-dehydropantoate 2-reductase
MTMLRTAVLGPGSIGGLIAALLTRTGSSVTCIASTSTAKRLSVDGLTVESERFGSFTVPMRATDRLEEPVDILVVAIKSTSLDDALSRIPRDVLGSAFVVPFLNGIEHVALLRERLTDAIVTPATIRIESARSADQTIQQRSPFATIEIAQVKPGSEIISEFSLQLKDAGFDVTLRSDEKVMLWEKLAILAPFALLTTAYGVPAGIICEAHREELEVVAIEMALVANAENVLVDPSSIVGFFDRVPESMQSSMQADHKAHRPLELEAIGGAVLRSADSHAIAVPAIARLVDLLRSV